MKSFNQSLVGLFQNKMRLSLTALITLAILVSLSPPADSEEKASLTPEPSSLNTGVTMYYRGDYQGSIKTFREIIKADPENDQARLNMAQLLKETGEYQEAISNLSYLTEKCPSEPAYRLALMEAAYLGGLPDLVLKLGRESETEPEALFWLGLACMDLKRYDEAEDFLKKSLAGQNFNPTAYYFLGQVSFEKSQYQQAEESFKKAIAQDYNLTFCYYPLIQSYLAQEKYQSAFDLLLKAESALPWNQTVAATLKNLDTAKPEFEAKRNSASAAKRKIVSSPAVKTVAADRNLIPEVRIGLMEKVQQLYIKTGGEFQIIERNGVQTVTGKADTVLLIRQNANQTEITTEEGLVLIRSSLPLLLSYREAEATTILFDAQYGKGYFWAGRQDRSYRGSLEFLGFNQGLTVVNRVNIEEYLYSVVPSEVPSSWPKAVLEAQAVAARTYTFANLKRFETRGFDLLPTVASQVYNGTQSETRPVTEAVNSTRSLILTYNSKPIGAFYYDNCGGYTESSQNVWGFPAPYLQAVPDKLVPPRDGLLAPFELYNWLKTRPEAYSNHPKYSNRSAYRWNHWVSREEIENRLKLTEKIGRPISLTVVERSNSGRAAKVLIKGTTGEKLLKGDAIRSLGGLRSNLFVIEPKLGADGLPEYFVFTGGGWGHGVGMAQSGAAGMAAAGFSYAEILAHYYQGSELTKKY